MRSDFSLNRSHKLPNPNSLLLLFLTFSALVANPKNYFIYRVANPARGLLNR